MGSPLTVLIWVAAVGTAAYALYRLALLLEARGWLFYLNRRPKVSLGLALGAVFDPAIRHIIAAKQREWKEEEDEAGDPKRRELPASLEVYKRTAEFSQSTVPAGLTKRHATRSGVWGRIRVVDGRLLYRVLEPELREELLDEANPGIIEPEVPHQVEPLGPVRFYVEFLRAVT